MTKRQLAVILLWPVVWLGAFCWNGERLVSQIFNGQTQEIVKTQRDFENLWRPINWLISRLPETEWSLPFKATGELISNLDGVIGLKGPRHYVMLLQNNTEIRPTGGFMGSYAQVSLENGKITQLKVEDIYVPDGQIKGYVQEPQALSKYLFNQGTPGWRLRDANWHPDFPESAKAIEWFFREGGVSQIDGFIAITLNPLLDLLDQTGEITLTDYQGLTVNRENFYQLTQAQAETNFFPGSTQKQDFLGGITKQLLFKISNREVSGLTLAKILGQNLHKKEIAIYLPKDTGEAWKQVGWDGSLRQTPADYLMINEANLGMNKANCCIKRQLSDQISRSDMGVVHDLSIKYENENPTTPNPPLAWGGGYKNYLRIIVPAKTEVETVTVDGTEVTWDQIETEEFGDKRLFGFLVSLAGGQKTEVKIKYEVSLDKNQEYSLLWQKQPGIDVWPVEITIDNRTTIKDVDRDVVFR